MSKKSAKAVESLWMDIPFFSVRNVSSPEDLASERSVHAGQMPITSILNLPTNENVREYLVEAEGKKRRVPTQVHLAIRETLEENSEMFSVLNGGIVIVARESHIDEKDKTLRLLSPSIINGSQTQGVIKDFLAGVQAVPEIHVKFELIITQDDDLIAEISIARNFQNDVQNLSIVGRRGQLDELEASIQKSVPDSKLQKSETQRPAEETDYLPTEKILQIIAALLPADLWWKPGDPNEVYTYSRKATCLKDFQEIFRRAKDTDGDNQRFRDVYKFYLDIAPYALPIYSKWKAHQGFAGSGLRSIVREGREVKEVPDGIVFPILASMSEFASKTRDGWRICPPEQMEDGELISAAKSAYMEIAKSRPEIMGKTKACYTALQQITSIYKRLAA